MKKTIRTVMFAMLAIGMFACGGNEKKLTYYDLKEAESTLFNEDESLNVEVAPQVAEQYCLFVKQNPDDSLADEWLYHAMEINVLLKEADKSADLCEQLLKQYPRSSWAPVSLFLLANYIYDGQLHDTAQAHATYQRLIDTYPQSGLVDDAKKSIEYLGMTPDEIMNKIMMEMQGFQEEGEVDTGWVFSDDWGE